MTAEYSVLSETSVPHSPVPKKHQKEVARRFGEPEDDKEYYKALSSGYDVIFITKNTQQFWLHDTYTHTQIYIFDIYMT